MRGRARAETFPERPLSGVRVIDLSRVLAGPFCAMLLADLGAEVIKVEAPGRGDDARDFGPHVDGQSTYYRLVNRNKLGVALDLKDPDDRDRFERLIERADVLVENFRPGALARLGLPVERLHELNGSLIVVSITGFGTTGPLRAKPAYDLLVQAMSGLMAATGPGGGPPTASAVSLGDVVPGLYAALGAVAALHERQRTGRGQHVDIAMLDGLLSILESVAMRALHTDEPIVPLGSDHALSAPYGTFRVADGEIAIAIANEPLFARFADLLGRPDWCTDPRFERDSERARNRDALREEVEAVLSPLLQQEALARLDGAGIPAGPILDVRAALAHPQAHEREMIIEEQDGFRTLGTALKLSGSPFGPPRPAPYLGEHQDLLEQWLSEPPRTGR